jgi:hypothetical protein
MARQIYAHDFADGPGGWIGWMGGGGGPRALDLSGGCATVRSPWGVDINHAPPGAGYLHLLYVMFPLREYRPDLSGTNTFLRDGFPTDFTDLEMTLELRGELDAKGAELMLLVQADVPRENPTVRANFVLSGQPIAITSDWSEQTIRLTADPAQWLGMGTRGPGADHDQYGEAPIAEVLRDVNVDLIFVLFPLDIAPATAITGDPHTLRAGKDYPINQTLLPTGHISLRRITFQYPVE